jgi:hypothetical protein
MREFAVRTLPGRAPPAPRAGETDMAGLQRLAGSRARPTRAGETEIAGLLRLQGLAGNSAVASLLAVQRDGPAPQSGDPPAVQVNAREVPSDKSSTTPPSAAGAAPSSDNVATTTTQWQLQTNYQGQRQYLVGKPAQDTMARQVAVQLNVQHHPDGAAGREESYAVQGSWDPVTGTLTGAQGQAQVALVSATMHGFQGQLFGQVSGGAAFDAAGAHATAGAAAGAQINYNLTKDTQVFLNGQVGYNATQGQGAGPNYAVGAGVTWTIPGT